MVYQHLKFLALTTHTKIICTRKKENSKEKKPSHTNTQTHTHIHPENINRNSVNDKL